MLPPATISELNKKAYVHIEDWRNRPLQGGRCPYVYVDGIYLRRNWGGEYENVAVLVAIAVNEDGFREVLGAAEGMKEDKASWINFFLATDMLICSHTPQFLPVTSTSMNVTLGIGVPIGRRSHRIPGEYLYR